MQAAAITPAGITDGRRGELIDDRLTKSRHPILSPRYGNKLRGFCVFIRQDTPPCLSWHAWELPSSAKRAAAPCLAAAPAHCLPELADRQSGPRDGPGERFRMPACSYDDESVNTILVSSLSPNREWVGTGRPR